MDDTVQRMCLIGWDPGNGETRDLSVANVSVLRTYVSSFKTKASLFWCLNRSKTMKFYPVLATCQNTCACLFSLSEGWFWNTGCKSLPCSAASFPGSSARLWKETKLPMRAECLLFLRQNSTRHFRREFSKASSIQLGPDKATHLYSFTH